MLLLHVPCQPVLPRLLGPISSQNYQVFSGITGQVGNNRPPLATDMAHRRSIRE